MWDVVLLILRRILVPVKSALTLVKRRDLLWAQHAEYAQRIDEGRTLFVLLNEIQSRGVLHKKRVNLIQVASKLHFRPP